MSVILKSNTDLQKLREAGRVAAHVLQRVEREIRPGMSTWDLDKIIHDEIIKNGATPSFLGYSGFPASSCISINDEVIHGIPNRRRIIHEGDVVSVDVGATYEGFVGDTAYTYGVGDISEEAEKLLRVTKESLDAAIKVAVAGARLGDIGHTVETYCRQYGYGVVREYCGHGVGREMHEEPEVLNYGKAGRGLRLVPGMVFCIEPMITLKGDEVRVLRDGWTAVTRSGAIAAHFEHEIAITSDGPVILTMP